MFFTPSDSSVSRMTIAFCSNQESTSDSGRSLTPQPSFSASGDRQNNRRVSVITLPGVDQARQPFDIAKVQFVEAVFTTGQGQDQAVIRHAGGEIGEVVTLPAGAVAAADEKDMAQFFTTDQIDPAYPPRQAGSDGQSRR